MGYGGAPAGASWQYWPPQVQVASSGQQAQTEKQTPEDAQKSVDQTTPEDEQGQDRMGSEAPRTSESGQPDELRAEIQAVLENVSAPDLAALGRAFKTIVRKPDERSSELSSTDLVDLGDLDGDGVSEVVLDLPVTAGSEEDTLGQAASPSLRGLYLLSWDGTRWKASRLAPLAESFQFQVVRLGESAGRCIAVVNEIGEPAMPYPAIFQLREHEAALLWDGRAENSLYNAFERGQIEFREDAKLDQTNMIETGRADPGLLRCERGGHRGFNAKCVYHWDGQAYVPERMEYAAGPDYTIYRFIAALHLHDFRSAYTLIDPGKFLKTGAPTLEKFHRMIQEDWPEFLDDRIFQAREAGAGSPDALAFELREKHYVYRPTLSHDGRFLLTGLERRVETPSEDSGGDSP
jgi:hypothetical protein